jgi:hypothetical protein
LRQLNNDLEVSLVGYADNVLIKDWYSGSSKQVDSIELSNGLTLMADDVQLLVNAMANFVVPALGQTSLSNEQHQALDGIITASWQ